MCDIYEEKCQCGSVTFGMHLGDFETPREDIKVSCPKCDGNVQINLFDWPRAVYWLAEDNVPITIYATTPVAKMNWMWNHPNEAYMLIGAFQPHGRLCLEHKTSP